MSPAAPLVIGALVVAALAVVTGSPWAWAGLAGLLFTFAWYVTSVARRLDRLHRRVEGAAFSLDAQLLFRAKAAIDVAVGGLLEPASAILLHAAASTAMASDIEHDAEASRLPGLRRTREAAESEFTRTLRATLEELDASQPLVSSPEFAELGQAAQRVCLARRFYNDAVTASLAVRRKRLVRWLHLAGSAPMPVTVEIDDTVAALLVSPVDAGPVGGPEATAGG